MEYMLNATIAKINKAGAIFDTIIIKKLKAAGKKISKKDIEDAIKLARKK